MTSVTTRRIGWPACQIVWTTTCVSPWAVNNQLPGDNQVLPAGNETKNEHTALASTPRWRNIKHWPIPTVSCRDCSAPTLASPQRHSASKVATLHGDQRHRAFAAQMEKVSSATAIRNTLATKIQGVDKPTSEEHVPEYTVSTSPFWTLRTVAAPPRTQLSNNGGAYVADASTELRPSVGQKRSADFHAD